MVVKSTIDLDKIGELVPEKRFYHEYNENIRSNVYKQYRGLKKKPREIKPLQLCERCQLQYEQERADKEKKQKKLFQNVDEISDSRGNTISLVLSRKEDEDILHDKYSVQNKSEKMENKLEEGEIYSDTEMD